MSSVVPDKLTTLQLSTVKLSVIDQHVLHVEIAVNKVNSMTKLFWHEYRLLYDTVAECSSIRAIVVSGGTAKLFTAGLDLTDHSSSFGSDDKDKDIGRQAYHQNVHIRKYQDTFTSQEAAPQPVIVCIHNGCIGGGVDLATAACIRLCTQDAYFVVKEVDVGLAADVGTLQRLQKVIGSASVVKDLCYTARVMKSAEALSCGLVSAVYDSKQACVDAGIAMARTIASKSPIAIVGTKNVLNYSRDHSVAEGLVYTATWNAAMLQSQDITNSFKAVLQKQKPLYSNL